MMPSWVLVTVGRSLCTEVKAVVHFFKFLSLCLESLFVFVIFSVIPRAGIPSTSLFLLLLVLVVVNSVIVTLIKHDTD